jgi:DNA-binding IscR family transcriptional regulator
MNAVSVLMKDQDAYYDAKYPRSEFLKASIIAHSIGAPYHFLSRTLMKLAKAGIIEVKRGPGGGFRVNPQRLPKVTAVDLVDVLGKGMVPYAWQSGRASDRLNLAVYDALNVSLEEFLG